MNCKSCEEIKESNSIGRCERCADYDFYAYDDYEGEE